MKKISLLIFTALVITSCQNKQSFSVHGIIHSAKQNYIYLNRVNVNMLIPLDSSKISGTGKFKFKIKASEPDFYQVGFTKKDFINLLAEPGEKIKLDFASNNLYSGYTVSGSKGSEQVRMLDVRLTETKKRLDSLRTVYDAASKQPDFSVKGPALDSEFTSLVKTLRRKNIEFIVTNTTSLAAIKALYQRLDDNTYVLYDPRDLQYMKIVTDSLLKYYPHSKHVQALAADTKKELDRMVARRLENLANAQPPKTLDPNLKDISGKRIALSSLKGKYVLVCFWSVESKDCIAENLQLKDYYKKYNRKGFEVYQINLDEKEDSWRKEVRFDELPWINTREDDPSRPENANLFNVK
jgi:thiol-disulfide isomerase/thioredoxin